MGKCVPMQGRHSDLVRSLVFTPDGKGLLSASWDKLVIYWDAPWLNEEMAK